jgi:hypothetical protein
MHSMPTQAYLEQTDPLTSTLNELCPTASRPTLPSLLLVWTERSSV